jgi:hypothetical protein
MHNELANCFSKSIKIIEDFPASTDNIRVGMRLAQKSRDW